MTKLFCRRLARVTEGERAESETDFCPLGSGGAWRPHPRSWPHSESYLSCTGLPACRGCSRPEGRKSAYPGTFRVKYSSLGQRDGGAVLTVPRPVSSDCSSYIGYTHTPL
ncbi:hypothetical protein RRG08_034068 [Elysia crispata]|uniref:Uncharacterized protein n=1 Tax=Elysia crispata TaxID=231223 RepID=A0AAE0YMB7_9GAST|nr:hypothetical protein RRG08_034068 [Elysia crispata]